MRPTNNFLKKLPILLTIVLTSLLLTSLAMPEIVHAQGGLPGGSAGTGDPLDFRNFMRIIYGIIFPTVVIIGFFKVVLAGYSIMTSAGDPQKIQGGKEDLTAAIMGMIFILGAVGILRILVGSIISGGDPGF